MSMWFFTIPDKSIILPAVALGLFPMAQFLRFTRSSVLEIVNEEYVRIARSKGLRAPVIYIRYILRNALIPLISVMSLQIGALLVDRCISKLFLRGLAPEGCWPRP